LLAAQTISMIDLVMSIGFSIDNVAHYLHAYMISSQNSPRSRAVEVPAPHLNRSLPCVIPVLSAPLPCSFPPPRPHPRSGEKKGQREAPERNGERVSMEKQTRGWLAPTAASLLSPPLPLRRLALLGASRSARSSPLPAATLQCATHEDANLRCGIHGKANLRCAIDEDGRSGRR